MGEQLRFLLYELGTRCCTARGKKPNWPFLFGYDMSTRCNIRYFK